MAQELMEKILNDSAVRTEEAAKEAAAGPDTTMAPWLE